MERIVKAFYEALDEGKILGRKCKACGAVEFPPRIACTTCGHFETEWVEMSGEGEALMLVLPSGMAHPRIDILKPCAFGCVKLKEGGEINAIVCGVTKENIGQLQSKLPLPVKARIVQREGYRSVVYDLVES